MMTRESLGSGGSTSSCLSRSLDSGAVVLPSLSPLTDRKSMRPTLGFENVGFGLNSFGLDVGWSHGALQVSTPDGRPPLSFFDSSLFSPTKNKTRARAASTLTFHSYNSHDPFSEPSRRPHTSGAFAGGGEDTTRSAGRFTTLGGTLPRSSSVGGDTTTRLTGRHDLPAHHASLYPPEPLSPAYHSAQAHAQAQALAMATAQAQQAAAAASQAAGQGGPGAAPTPPPPRGGGAPVGSFLHAVDAVHVGEEAAAAAAAAGRRPPGSPSGAASHAFASAAHGASVSTAGAAAAAAAGTAAAAEAARASAAAEAAAKAAGGPGAAAGPGSSSTQAPQQPKAVTVLQMPWTRPGTSSGLPPQKGSVAPGRPGTSAGMTNSQRLHAHHPMASYKPTRGHSLIVFNEMDCDKNGKLTRSEFEDAAVRLGFSLNQATTLFNKLDKRSRGFLEAGDWGNQDWGSLVQGFTLMYMQRFMGLPDVTSTSEQVRKYFQREKLREVKSLPAACNMVRVNAVTRGSHNSGASGNAVFDSFNFIDTDGSGDLSKEELRDAFFSLGVFLSEAVVGQIMDVFDRDGDGVVNYHEFIRTMFPASSRSTR